MNSCQNGRQTDVRSQSAFLDDEMLRTQGSQDGAGSKKEVTVEVKATGSLFMSMKPGLVQVIHRVCCCCSARQSSFR